MRSVMEISPTQRIVATEFRKQPMFAARDHVKLLNRCVDDVPIIWGHSVVTSLAPKKQGVVRADSRVEGVVVRELSTSTCEVVMVGEANFMGVFDNKRCGKLLKCCGVTRLLQQAACSEGNGALLRLKQLAEATPAAPAHTLLQQGTLDKTQKSV